MVWVFKISLFSIIILSFLLAHSVLAFNNNSESLEKTACIPFVFAPNTTGLENFTQFQIEYASRDSYARYDMPSLTNEPMILEIPADELLKKVEPFNDIVKSEASQIVAGRSGALTIDQVSSIYDFMRYGNGQKSIGPWNYVLENYEVINYANETLLQGKVSSVSGTGDCDDFAVVMASLVQSIGGTARINLVPSNHIYAEVYLGNLEQDEKELISIVNWIMWKYRVNKIYTHVDPVSKDVWLNLDAPLRLGDKAYLGFPFRKSIEPHKIAISLEEDRIGKKRVNRVEYSRLSAIINDAINDPASNGDLRKVDEILILANLMGMPKDEVETYLRYGLKNFLVLLNLTMQKLPPTLLPFAGDDNYSAIIDLIIPDNSNL